ncbi:MAG: holo-ACP synthase [Chitinispirillia bacterium]|jgi:holo-[acyl-carrier protein] synthase
MIKGIGVDITDISRIERLINNYQDLFINKIFTPDEIEYCRKKANPSIHYAGRWAAKEAFYKALPQSSQLNSTWKSIEIINRATFNKPFISINCKRLLMSLRKHHITKYHVSISHERKYCISYVILEAENE